MTKEIENQLKEHKYEYGFSIPIENETFPIGLNEDIIILISRRKNEPQWLLDWRLKAFEYWKTLIEPTWGCVSHSPINYQNISYFSSSKKKSESKEIDPELQKYFERLGVPMKERDILAGNIAVDAILDSESVGTTFHKKLDELGIIFCPFSEAVQKYPHLVKEYLGSVVHYRDNFFAALNSAVFSDGSFCYIPKKTKCPMDLSTYFRINQANIGQFERTLIIAEEESYVSYLEGCSAMKNMDNQLHAAVVEIIALEKAHVRYSTVQNWYPGNDKGEGGVYNFVTKRADCRGDYSHVSWTQVETGSAITWKYPSILLKGKESKGEFYSVALTNHYQQADTGTKMIHIGEKTSSTIISKSISAGQSSSTYRGLVRVSPKAKNAKNFTQCDSLIFGDAQVNTLPYIEAHQNDSNLEHEATTSKISEEQLFYLQSRGLQEEQAKNLIINGFCKSVFQKLPGEFAVEAQKLLEINLEGSLG